jgi:hypothetical protein
MKLSKTEVKGVPVQKTHSTKQGKIQVKKATAPVAYTKKEPVKARPVTQKPVQATPAYKPVTGAPGFRNFLCNEPIKKKRAGKKYQSLA